MYLQTGLADRWYHALDTGFLKRAAQTFTPPWGRRLPNKATTQTEPQPRAVRSFVYSFEVSTHRSDKWFGQLSCNPDGQQKQILPLLARAKLNTRVSVTPSNRSPSLRVAAADTLDSIQAPAEGPSGGLGGVRGPPAGNPGHRLIPKSCRKASPANS